MRHSESLYHSLTDAYVSIGREYDVRINKGAGYMLVRKNSVGRLRRVIESI